MAVEPLPPVQSADTVAPTSWTADVRDLLAWFRDDRPIFKGQGDLGGPLLETGGLNVYGFANAAGTFYHTPLINVGGWTASSGSGVQPLIVPEPGIYLGMLHTSWPPNSTGHRYHDLRVEGSAVVASSTTIEATTTTTRTNSTFVLDAAANDEIDLRLLQNSGDDLDPSPFVTLIWMQST